MTKIVGINSLELDDEPNILYWLENDSIGTFGVVIPGDQTCQSDSIVEGISLGMDLQDQLMDELEGFGDDEE